VPISGPIRGPGPAPADIERVFRDEYGRAVAVLARVFGDIDIAEDAVQDAFAEAVRRWPSAGLPPSPAGWIITTARNRAIDRLRREAARDGKHAQAVLLHAHEDKDEEGPVRDDRLRLIFTCCHPARRGGSGLPERDRPERERGRARPPNSCQAAGVPSRLGP
jgi:RNA polymerase sigma-70 factor, ECF subfamily